jgi:hypothetical protein
MGIYDFVLIVDGLDLTSDEDLDRLFEAGLDDATPSVVDTVQYLDVTREGGSYGQALSAALRQAGAAGATVRHVLEVDEDGQPRSGLVSLADIARRTGWTREYIRLLATGKRGPGDFPSPHRDSSPALYAWADVVEWLTRHPSAATSAEYIRDMEREREIASVTRYANVALEFEHLDPDMWQRGPTDGTDVASLIERKGQAVGT